VVDQLIKVNRRKETVPILFCPEFGRYAARDVIGRKEQRGVDDRECDRRHLPEQDCGRDEERCCVGRDVQRQCAEAVIFV
jgi:hypothetical protein